MPATPRAKTKINTTTLIGSFNGIEVYGLLKPAKRTGKDRLWIQLRQPDTRPYRVSESLSYARAVDILFEKID